MRRSLVHVLPLFVVLNFVIVPTGGAEEEREGRPTPTPFPPMTCAEAVEKGIMEAAVEPCRAELAAEPDSERLIRLGARVEFAEGDPALSAELWQQLLDREGWNDAAARGRAMALWRAGEIPAAEALLRQRVEREPSPSPRHDLIDFLLGFDRFEEAARLAASASADFPEDCLFFEDQAVATAGLGDDARAVELIAKAVASGCSRFQWTTRGVLANRVDHPAYRPLLEPSLLVEGLAKLDNDECVQRLRLLRPVFTPAQAPAVTDEVLNRKTAEVRLAGLGLLASLGGRAAPSFTRLLASDDFILRKRVLREIREIHDPAFLPLLEQHLEREPLPGNRSLTALALGELLLDGDRAKEGERLLLGIPSDQPTYPVARLVLAQWADKRGEPDRARALVEEARAVEPKLFVDRALLERLGLPLAPPTPTPAPEPLPEPTQSAGE